MAASQLEAQRLLAAAHGPAVIRRKERLRDERQALEQTVMSSNWTLACLTQFCWLRLAMEARSASSSPISLPKTSPETSWTTLLPSQAPGSNSERQISPAIGRLREAGMREFRHAGSVHVYFSAPGGQVVRLLDVSYDGP